MKKQNNIAVWFIYIASLLLPFYIFRFDIGSLGTNVFEAAVLAALIATLFFSNSKQVDKKVVILTVLLLVASIISVLIAPDKTKALGIVKGWFLVPIVYSYCVYRNFNRSNIISIIIPLYLSLLIVSVWAILQNFGFIRELFYQVGDPSFGAYFVEGRAFGPFESPNYLAMFIAPVTILSLSLWQVIKRSWLKILFLITLLLPLLALYFSASRGGIIALLVGAVIFMLFNRYSHDSKKERLIKAVLIIITLIIALAGIKYYISTKASHAGGDNIRQEIYSYSTTMVKENTVLGVGLGDFQNKINIMSKENGAFQLYALPYALHPHNLYLALWLNLGLLGIVSFLLLLIYLLVSIFSSKDNFMKAILLGALATILVHGLVDTTYFKNDLSAIFWLIFALGSIARMDKSPTLSS